MQKYEIKNLNVETFMLTKYHNIELHTLCFVNFIYFLSHTFHCNLFHDLLWLSY